MTKWMAMAGAVSALVLYVFKIGYSLYLILFLDLLVITGTYMVELGPRWGEEV